jgi:xylulokinase
VSTELLLGIDIGTSSSKGVLVTPRGEIVARAATPHETSNPRQGWFEHDAERIWWADFHTLVGRLRAEVPDARVAALGVSGIGPCLLPADADGAPLRPAILYGVDSRAGPQIAELDAALGADQIRECGGSALTSQAVGPKLLWLRQVEPSVYARTRMVFMASSYLIHRLTGRYVLDHHSASQCNPMYDLAAQRWKPDWCEFIAPGLPLPELAWPSEVVGVISDEGAALSGLAEGTPVTAGTIDAWAEATSVGVRDPGDLMLMYGTTMFMVQVVDGVARRPGLWSTTGVWPGSYCLAASLTTSGAVTEWLRKLTSSDFPTLLDEAGRATPGANGLLLLPHFEGARTPVFDPDARGMIAGLTLAHTRGDLYRAALEAIAFGVRHNIEAMVDAESGASLRLVAVGGGTQGGLWTQIVTDVTGLEQRLPAETIGACFGDALLAGVASGAVLDAQQWNRDGDTVRPDPALRRLYDERYNEYRELYDATRDTAHRLAATQRIPQEQT